jgi:hypothetical protein
MSDGVRACGIWGPGDGGTQPFCGGSFTAAFRQKCGVLALARRPTRSLGGFINYYLLVLHPLRGVRDAVRISSPVIKHFDWDFMKGQFDGTGALQPASPGWLHEPSSVNGHAGS